MKLLYHMHSLFHTCTMITMTIKTETFLSGEISVLRQVSNLTFSIFNNIVEILKKGVFLYCSGFF